LSIGSSSSALAATWQQPSTLIRHADSGIPFQLRFYAECRPRFVYQTDHRRPAVFALRIGRQHWGKPTSTVPRFCTAADASIARAGRAC
jgi:hypothetical protein